MLSKAVTTYGSSISGHFILPNRFKLHPGSTQTVKSISTQRPETYGAEATAVCDRNVKNNATNQVYIQHILQKLYSSNPSQNIACGIDQTIFDITITGVDDSVLTTLGLEKGQSQLINQNQSEQLERLINNNKKACVENAGGTIGNTLHNTSVLSGASTTLFGVISEALPGNRAFHYLRNSFNGMNLNDLCLIQGGQIGCAYTLISNDSERTFGVSLSDVNQLPAEAIKALVIQESSCLVMSAYPLADESQPIYAASQRAVKLAHQYHKPILMTLGSANLVQHMTTELQNYLSQNIMVVAMNGDEAQALTGKPDIPTAAMKVLDYTDLALITDGKNGLYFCGYIDRPYSFQPYEYQNNGREPEQSIKINQYTKSYPALKINCLSPYKIVCHEPACMKNQDMIVNTNGAGDAAMSALIHCLRISDNPFSPDNKGSALPLTHTTFSETAMYANWVSKQVVQQVSPRLLKAL
ncbi:PfkB family carbohydrate kinase [Endozoicomonas ascidiicola]|uniref:PfkB family carbohydrate kinase n=1 Tax=Endozoicomonas ascidiicola TaxID=1698521 RepID=UPI0008379FD4|nr:PfkB family carbohydrate kinase [Endozoicomonas ascidiicola]